jgi:hypothetical protein
VTTQWQRLTRTVAAAALAVGAGAALASGSDIEKTFCMDVDLGPFHLLPDGSCAVRDYWDGWLQEKFYPFTSEDHQFNCEYWGASTPLPTGDQVPSSVVSEEGGITGTIGGHPFAGTLLCASLTNWYADFCPDPFDPEKPCFQLAQPFFNLIDRDPYPRVTEVSVLDGIISVERGKGKAAEIPVLMATRAAGITHLEGLDPPQVGASVTHSLLGLLTYKADRDEIKPTALDGSLDVLLQGHIFFPDSVENDPGAARIRGALCSEALHRLLTKKARKGRDDD